MFRLNNTLSSCVSYFSLLQYLPFLFQMSPKVPEGNENRSFFLQASVGTKGPHSPTLKWSYIFNSNWGTGAILKGEWGVKCDLGEVTHVLFFPGWASGFGSQRGMPWTLSERNPLNVAQRPAQSKEKYAGVTKPWYRKKVGLEHIAQQLQAEQTLSKEFAEWK